MRRIALLFLLAFAATSVAAQNVIPLGPDLDDNRGSESEVVVDFGGNASDVDIAEATADSAHGDRTMELVREAVRDSDLRPRRKARMLRLLKYPSVQDRVKMFVTGSAIDAGEIDTQIIVMPDGSIAMPAIDWDNLLSFIERLLPLILQLISLFG